MDDSDEQIRQRLVRDWRDVDRRRQPSFDSVWRAAERSIAVSKRYRHGAAWAAGIVGATAVFMMLRAPIDDPAAYIEVAEVLESTYWSAPSDVLLPERQFDIYQDLPVFIESTERDGGALL